MALARLTDQPTFALDRSNPLHSARFDITIARDEDFDLAEVGAAGSKTLPAAIRRVCRLLGKTTLLHFKAGAIDRADLNILLGKNVDAGRISRCDFSSEGTGYVVAAAQKHEKMLEEAYLTGHAKIRNGPSSGIQRPHRARALSRRPEGDVVDAAGLSSECQPTTGGNINFLWRMAANRERGTANWRRQSAARVACQAGSGSKHRNT